MIFAIDYDECVSRDKEFFEDLVMMIRDSGHTVCLVTNNSPGTRPDIDEFSALVNTPVYYTGMHGKKAYLSMRGVEPDVWIDDDPESIVM